VSARLTDEEIAALKEHARATPGGFVIRTAKVRDVLLSRASEVEAARASRSAHDARESPLPFPDDAGPRCDACKGRGWIPGDCHPREVCGTCNGTGYPKSWAAEEIDRLDAEVYRLRALAASSPPAPAPRENRETRGAVAVCLRCSRAFTDHPHAKDDRCVGFVDDPAASCLACGKRYDEHPTGGGKCPSDLYPWDFQAPAAYYCENRRCTWRSYSKPCERRCPACGATVWKDHSAGHKPRPALAPAPAPAGETTGARAAKVIEAARRVVCDLYYADGPGGLALNELRARLSDLAAPRAPHDSGGGTKP
jgi:hypothetical protein